MAPYFIGFTDNQVEGIWKTAETGLNCGSLGFTDWGKNEPSGGTNENCAAIYHVHVLKGKWVDIGCHAVLRSLCQIIY